MAERGWSFCGGGEETYLLPLLIVNPKRHAVVREYCLRERACSNVCGHYGGPRHHDVGGAIVADGDGSAHNSQRAAIADAIDDFGFSVCTWSAPHFWKAMHACLRDGAIKRVEDNVFPMLLWVGVCDRESPHRSIYSNGRRKRRLPFGFAHGSCENGKKKKEEGG